MQVYFFTPYAIDKKLFNAIDQCINLIGADDWAVLMDGDVMFLRSDFGHVIREYILKYPDTGLFTCYASRCHYAAQRIADYDMDNDSVLLAKKYADMCHRSYPGQVVPLDKRIAGHLMVISKKTWMLIREKVRVTTKDKNILGVDTKITKRILARKMPVRLMKSLLVFHYLRMAEGLDSTKHLTN